MKETRKGWIINEQSIQEMIKNPSDCKARKGKFIAMTKDKKVIALYNSDIKIVHRSFTDFIKAATWLFQMEKRDKKLIAERV